MPPCQSILPVPASLRTHKISSCRHGQGLRQAIAANRNRQAGDSPGPVPAGRSAATAPIVCASTLVSSVGRKGNGPVIHRWVLGNPQEPVASGATEVGVSTPGVLSDGPLCPSNDAAAGGGNGYRRYALGRTVGGICPYLWQGEVTISPSGLPCLATAPRPGECSIVGAIHSKSRCCRGRNACRRASYVELELPGNPHLHLGD